MSAKKNPLGLNPLQLKTLTVLQQMAHTPRFATPQEDGAVMVANFPPPHGDHYHVGDATVMGRDMTGLHNIAVLAALERKGLIRSGFPGAALLTADGLAYDTGLADAILHRADH
ncbi:hypothetical protein E9232_000785 [Inquilinus ginsengisoli]|uniref:Uncharacterized protein n=1 Tax=Inquilinus ginsengisoli TaxID=363840 RepID=A0ABU1JIX5_9PROT|nr:hypothetical protein [Inquilinus ginsengisoli]MDR6288278.1 hypothetical protein [Inquilinus ginsengisoli]